MRFLVVNPALRTIRSEQLTHVHSDSGLAERLRDLGPIDATADWINLYKNGQLFGQVIGGTQTDGPSFLIEGGIQTQLGTNVFVGHAMFRRVRSEHDGNVIIDAEEGEFPIRWVNLPEAGSSLVDKLATGEIAEGNQRLTTFRWIAMQSNE